MNDILKNELDDIKISYELLIDGIEILETKIMDEYIPECSKNAEMDKVLEGVNFINQIKLHLDDIIILRDNWKALFNEKDIITEAEQEEQEDQEEINDKDVIERTNWSIENNNIRIETMRKDGNGYSNIIPVEIFINTTETILDQFERYNKTFFKKSGIASLMKEKIVDNTNYKKSPDTVVYSVVKVLLKENILKRNKNYKSIYTLNIQPDEIRKWISLNIIIKK